MNNSLFLLKTAVLFALLLPVLTACGYYDVTEKTIEAKDLAYIKALGLFEDGETMLRHEGSVSPFHRSGSFLTDERIAGYYVEGDEKEIHSAFYREIDSMTLTDKTRAVTYSSFVTVYPADSLPFTIYIDLDSAGIHSFFDAAEANWKKYK